MFANPTLVIVPVLLATSLTLLLARDWRWALTALGVLSTGVRFLAA